MWSAATRTEATPEQVIRVLTDPDAIGEWSPVAFAVDELDGAALATGSQARVTGSLAGMRVGFDVAVQEASEKVLRLTAEGPIGIDVRYDLIPDGDGSEVEASVAIRSRGLTGRLLAKATEGLLAAGALEGATGRIARAAERSPALAIA